MENSHKRTKKNKNHDNDDDGEKMPQKHLKKKKTLTNG